MDRDDKNTIIPGKKCSYPGRKERKKQIILKIDNTPNKHSVQIYSCLRLATNGADFIRQLL